MSQNPILRILQRFKSLARRFQVHAMRDSGTLRFTLAFQGWPFALKMKPPQAKESFPVEVKGIKLNVGGGKGHPKVAGWNVVDLREQTADVVLDICKNPLPFANNSVDVIFTSHTLEHIYPQRLNFVLSEFHRVLKPEVGLLRIAVPDIALAIKAYVKKDEQFFLDGKVGLVAYWPLGFTPPEYSKIQICVVAMVMCIASTMITLFTGCVGQVFVEYGEANFGGLFYLNCEAKPLTEHHMIRFSLRR